MAADRPAQRHDLVWLGAGWRGALVAPLAPADEAAVAAWLARGRPAVVRRAEAAWPAGAPPGSTPPGNIALGIALPLAQERRRLALVVDGSALERRRPPLALRDALPSAPPGWRAPLAALDAALGAAGAPAAVFGSLAWQHLVGEPYLRPGSDVDLLLRPAGPAALAAALAALQAHRRAGLPPLDGEVLLPDGRAVAWRELAGRQAQLLVKSLAGVELVPRATALAWLRGGLAAPLGPGAPATEVP